MLEYRIYDEKKNVESISKEVIDIRNRKIVDVKVFFCSKSLVLHNALYVILSRVSFVKDLGNE